MNVNYIFGLLILFVLFLVINYLNIWYKNRVLENFSKLNSKLTKDDEIFISKCFSQDELRTFEKYYGYTNINRYFKDNIQVGNIFYTENNTILETPKLTDNGLFISHLCVEKDYRNKGIGKYIMKDVLMKAKKFKYDYVVLLVEKENKIALNMYKKMGFIAQNEGYIGNNKALYLVMYL